MSEVGTAWVSLVPSAKGFGTKLTSQVGPEVDRAGSRMGGMFSGALKAGALGVMAAAGGVLASALFKGFQRLDSIDQARAKLDGLGHSTKAVDRIMANALASVQGTAFGLDEAATTAAGAVAAGVAPGKALTRTLSLVGDAATIAGTDMGTMGAIFNKVAASDMIQGDVLAQLGDAGIPILQLLAKEMGVSATAVRDLASKGAIDFKTFQNAMEEGLGGAALKSGDTFSGAFKNMQASLGRIGANLLSGLFPQLQGGFTSLTAVMSNLEPAAARVGAAIGQGVAAIAANIGPAIAAVKSAFDSIFGGEGGLGASIATNFLPVLQTMATTFTTSILPAITRLGSYLVAQLGPVFTQVAGIISGQVIPILASLAQWFYGTLYPALVRVATVVASNLRPVFEQLVATFRGSVLPAIQQILAKFREWQPTIQKVIGVLLNLSGQAIAFAAVILGKVLPPVIRFAGFIISNVVPAILAWIGMVGNIIGKLVSFGKAVVDRVQDFARFAAGVREKVGEVVKIISALPGTILGLLSGLASKMYAAGAEMMSMLANGIRDKIGDALGALKDAAGQLAALVPGSPVKDGPLKSLNNGHAGKEMMGMLARGIKDGTAEPVDAMKDAASKMLAALQEKRDGIKTVVDSIKSDMASLASSISTAFTGNPFEALTGSDMFAQGVATQRSLSGLRKAFKKLVKWGIDPKFLSSLFTSGNSALILDLASGPKWQATNNANLFDSNQQLANQLGGQVARNQYGDKLDKQIDRLERIERAIKRIGNDVGREINSAAASGQRRRRVA